VSRGKQKFRGNKFEEAPRDTAGTASNKMPRPDNDGLAWPMERVLLWLDTNGFSTDWQETFRALNISASRFLEVTNGRSHPGQFNILDNEVYPQLARKCIGSGTGWNQTWEREEGKRLRYLVHDIVKGKAAEFPKERRRYR
jgi:mitogen-activated protein kinase kinase kinase